VDRTIRGPDLDQPRLTSGEAAEHIRRGMEADTLDGLMALHLPTVRPVWVGGRKYWRWMDVAVLDYVLSVAVTEGPRKRRESEEAEK
jgi:hypothetical protein